MNRTNHSESVAAKPLPNAQSPVSVKGNRRKFFQNGSILLAGGSVVGANLRVAQAAHAFGSDEVKIGLVGCGDRGTHAAMQALNTTGGGTKLVAMGDVFHSNIQSAVRAINSRYASQVDIRDSRFCGFDAFSKVIDSDADVVILATPPGFRPLHFEAAVAAGKHVFMEKPVATDAPGVRRVLAANAIAKQKGLTVQVGLQRRHEVRYRECIERLQDGAIGRPVFARVYWNGTGPTAQKRKPGQTELEYQLRNWYYFNWLSGDCLTEQHVHNLDVINWLVGANPVQAQGQGGRQVRNLNEHGEVFDHHMVEYTYAGGMKMISQCRHIDGCHCDVSEHLHGTEGHCDISKAQIYDVSGKLKWASKSAATRGKGWQQEQDDLFAALRSGDAINEVDAGAASTMTAIMGRMATYGGNLVKWDDALASEIRLAEIESLTSLDSPAPVSPGADGLYQSAIPGKTTAV